MSRLTRIAAVLFLGALLAGCYYAPYPPGPSNYERSWNAAIGGMQDAGINITSTDPQMGVIRGTTRDGINATVTVSRMADGRTEKRFDSSGPTSRDPGLADRYSQAYERRMGR